MCYLIFCSYEVGGLPFRMAEILNRYGYRTYYISVHKSPTGHDSTAFHHNNSNAEWNLTAEFENIIDFDEKIVNKLKVIKHKYNIIGCFATGSKAFLLASARIKYNYWSYGSDLDQLSSYKKWPDACGMFRKIIFTLISFGCKKIVKASFPDAELTLCSKKGNPLKFHFSNWLGYSKIKIQQLPSEQVKSIVKSKCIIVSPYQIDSYLKICPGKPKSFFPHFFPQTQYETLAEQKLANKNIVKENIGTDNFFFSSTRHFWHGGNQKYDDDKGNDIIFYAFFKYLQITADSNTKLVLVAKGPDVAHSIALARELGISKKVVWLDEMSRDELKTYYSAAQVAFGQFGSPVLAFSALEPLAEATPCISFFLDGRAQGVPFYEKSPPLLNTKDPEQIAEYLAHLATNHEDYTKASYAAWQWIQDNCLEIIFAKKMSAMLGGTISTRKDSNIGKQGLLTHICE